MSLRFNIFGRARNHGVLLCWFVYAEIPYSGKKLPQVDHLCCLCLLREDIVKLVLETKCYTCLHSDKKIFIYSLAMLSVFKYASVVYKLKSFGKVFLKIEDNLCGTGVKTCSGWASLLVIQSKIRI